MQVIENTIASLLTRRDRSWRVHTAGNLDVLPEQADAGSTLDDLARQFDPGDIDRHMYQPELPVPELIIRPYGTMRGASTHEPASHDQPPDPRP